VYEREMNENSAREIAKRFLTKVFSKFLSLDFKKKTVKK
jgi:hypothetical protein